MFLLNKDTRIHYVLSLVKLTHISLFLWSIWIKQVTVIVDIYLEKLFARICPRISMCPRVILEDIKRNPSDS